jgi:activator of HSP90 ATPase
MERIKQTYTIKASKSKVWQALVDPKIIKEWGGNPLVMDDKEGTEFKLWDGDIYGKNLKVIPEKLLIQQWNDGSFERPSEVRFELSGDSSQTTIHLVHSNVPNERSKDISEGWKEYYLGPLKKMLESS